MTVLVTGATSRIGEGVVRELVAGGERVRCLQRHHNEALDAVGADVVQYQGDITDSAAVQRSVEGCDAVIHLAAKVGVTGDRSEYRSVNVDGTENLVRSAAASGVTSFVHVSTPSVAHAGDPIVGEGASAAILDHGTSWYAETKAIAERGALAASSASMGVVAIRPHLVWGPGDTQLVGRIIERARAGSLALVGGGTALVDTTYIDNAISALVAARRAVAPGATCAGRAYVVSNGEPRPIRELVEGICRAAGVEFAPRTVPLPAARVVGSLLERVWPRLQRDDEPPLTRFLADQLGTAHWFDIRSTCADLAWAPTVTIDEGLERLAASFG